MKKKIVLAFSGGLDTTAILPWLKEHYEADIIAVCVDIGLDVETEHLDEKALSLGASKFYLVDAQEEFVTDYIWPTLKAGAIYENKYLLGTAMARPLIAKKLVEIALVEDAYAICHGATGKGNDQVRFELAVKALAPFLKIIAPWRLWDLKSREDEIAYLESKGIAHNFTSNNSYSRDRNLWHLSHEGLELENPGQEPNYAKILILSVPPEQAPDLPTYVDIGFENGVPVKLNGQVYAPVEMITALNQIGGKNGVGIIDMLENRVIGIKSRGIYETPGGAILYCAHQQLEAMCLDKQTYQFKQMVGTKFAELLYSGEWFTPLREALSAFVDGTQKTVTGTVKLKLYKGNIVPAGSYSPYSLYNENLSSFATGDLFNHQDAEGFINLFGLPLQVRALLQHQAPTEHPIYNHLIPQNGHSPNHPNDYQLVGAH